MSQIVLYCLNSASVLSIYIDVVLTLPILQDLAKYESRKINALKYSISEKFDKLPINTTVDAAVKFQSDAKTETTNRNVAKHR